MNVPLKVLLNISLMEECDLHHQRVVIRVDLNVPIEKGKILNDARIQAILPTVQLALKQQAAIILLSHLGQPQEGEEDPNFSLKPVADRLQVLLNYPVRFERHWLKGVNVQPGEIVLCENVRFNRGEAQNDPILAQQIANLGDIFIFDAFAVAHRAQASTVGIIHYAKKVAAGPLLVSELNALKQVFNHPKRPLLAIVGGAKVSSKLLVLKFLIQQVDTLIVGGGMANTFIAAQGGEIGDSLYEPDLLPVARELIHFAKERKINFIIPEDVVVATELSNNAVSTIRSIGSIEVSMGETSTASKRKFLMGKALTASKRQALTEAVLPQEKILDIGLQTVRRCQDVIKAASTIIWNGPLGVFEYAPFAKGTQAIAQAIANSFDSSGHSVFSLAGGGETLAAIDKFGVRDKISYISTGGGAFLEYLEGKTLPAVAALEERERIALESRGR